MMELRRCSVDECKNKYFEVGLCATHYKRFRKYGDLIKRSRAIPSSKHLRNGYVFVTGGKRDSAFAEHTLVAETLLGRYLVYPEQIHHFNEIRSDNRPENLVICPDNAYHKLLHRRQRAMNACGHADWVKCKHCKTWDSPDNLTLHGTTGQHKSCHAKYAAERKRLKFSSQARM